MKLSPELAAKCLALAGVAPLPANCSEKQFQAAVVAEAERLGWAAYHTYDSRRSAAGFPDLVLIRGGRLIAAELKVKRNKTTAAQEAWLALFAAVPGCRACRWLPEMWAEITKELGE